LNLERDLITTDEDIKALEDNRPVIKSDSKIDFDLLNVPAWLVSSEMLRKVVVAGQPVFEL